MSIQSKTFDIAALHKSFTQSTVSKAMINENVQMVQQLATQYADRGIALPKLIQRGHEELVAAARRFDVSRGFSFKVYAAWWIKSAMAAMIAQKNG